MAEEPERPRLPEVPPTPEGALELVRMLAEDFRRVEEERRILRDQLGQALTLASQRGYSWADVAKAADFLRGTVAQQWSLPLVEPDPAAQRLDGVTVAQAAEILGVTPVTVYNRIKDGRLKATRDPSGRARVILPPPGG